VILVTLQVAPITVIAAVCFDVIVTARFIIATFSLGLDFPFLLLPGMQGPGVDFQLTTNFWVQVSLLVNGLPYGLPASMCSIVLQFVLLFLNH
jgi:hypothetical protein